MTSVELVLEAMKTALENSTMGTDLGDRIWIQPYDGADIKFDTFPFAVISKMNTEPGSFNQFSYGVNQHTWEILVAVYLEEGMIIPTNSDERTLTALTGASEWYEKFGAMLNANFTLNGAVDTIGDPEGSELFQYITDNIIWDTRQFYGHLFRVEVTQTVTQTVAI